MREKWKSLLSEYGPVAAVVYFSIFFLTLGGFALAIKLGFDVKSAEGGVGVFGAAYIATKLTQPIRIAATLGLTPIAAAGWKKLRGKQ
jgi:hypothetical protein